MRRGSALILVLWTLSVLTIFSISLGYTVRQKMTLLYRLNALQGLYDIALSGVEQAKGIVKSDIDPEFDTLVDSWAASEAVFKDIGVGDGNFSVSYLQNGSEIFGVVDESRKININLADVTVIARLLKIVLGFDQDEANQIAYSIVDWRDSDSNLQSPDDGAEDNYYDDLNISYQCKDSKFEVIDELLLVRGINRQIFDKIKPFVTVYGITEAVNINTAPAPVFLALGLDAKLVDKIIYYRAGADRKEGTSDDAYFSSVTDLLEVFDRSTSPPDFSERATLANLIAQDKIAVGSFYFMAHSVAKIERSRAQLELESVFNRQGKTVYTHFSEIQWQPKS